MPKCKAVNTVIYKAKVVQRDQTTVLFRYGER